MTRDKNIKTPHTDLKPKIKLIDGDNYGMNIPTISSFKYNPFYKKGSRILIRPEEKKLPLLDYALDTL